MTEVEIEVEVTQTDTVDVCEHCGLEGGIEFEAEDSTIPTLHYHEHCLESVALDYVPEPWAEKHDRHGHRVLLVMTSNEIFLGGLGAAMTALAVFSPSWLLKGVAGTFGLCLLLATIYLMRDQARQPARYLE